MSAIGATLKMRMDGNIRLMELFVGGYLLCGLSNEKFREKV